MKRYFFLSLLFVCVATIAQATVLFPFFGDIAANNKLILRLVTESPKSEQVMYSGYSTWGSMEDCISFLQDVLPEDAGKQQVDANSVVFISVFHTEDETKDVIDTGNKVSAIYLIKKGKTVEIFYTESDATQQKEWQSEILKGKYGVQSEFKEIKKP